MALDVRGSWPTTTFLWVSPRARPAFSASSGVIFSLMTPLMPEEPKSPIVPYSTVTDFARLRGLSTGQPEHTATWYANICSTMADRTGETNSLASGTRRTTSTSWAMDSSLSLAMAITEASRALISLMLLVIFS